MNKFIFSLIAVFPIFLILNCNGFNSSSSMTSPVTALDKIGDEEIMDLGRESPEVQDILKEIDDMPTGEVLAYAVASDKPVKICMSYVYSESASSHQCNGALFEIYLNGVKSEKKLNLNNSSPTRQVIGIQSGRTLLVPAVSLDQDTDIQFRRRAYPDDHYSVIDVPGIEYETLWNENGEIEINTECDPSLTENGISCHKGVATFHMIGNVDVIYKGYVITKTMRSRVGKIDTNKKVTVGFKSLDIEKFDDAIYTCDDWCQPKFVEKTRPRVTKAE